MIQIQKLFFNFLLFIRKVGNLLLYEGDKGWCVGSFHHADSLAEADGKEEGEAALLGHVSEFGVVGGKLLDFGGELRDLSGKEEQSAVCLFCVHHEAREGGGEGLAGSGPVLVDVDHCKRGVGVYLVWVSWGVLGSLGCLG